MGFLKPGRIRNPRRGRVTHGSNYHDETNHSGIGRQVYQSEGIRRGNIGRYYNLHSNRFKKVGENKTTDGIKRNRFHGAYSFHYGINFDVDDDDIQTGYTKLQQQQFKVASRVSSVLAHRMPFPMQNRGLDHLLASGRGKGVSVISTMHPAKKTKTHLSDAQKMMNTGVEVNNPNNKRHIHAADQGDNIGDVFQGPGEEAEGSLIPFDVRFGASHVFSELKEQPTRFGNMEMVKQSHFMHLTPTQIKKHCKELKQFMTEFYPHAEMFYARHSNVPSDQLKNLYETMMQEAKIIEDQYNERKAN